MFGKTTVFYVVIKVCGKIVISDITFYKTALVLDYFSSNCPLQSNMSTPNQGVFIINEAIQTKLLVLTQKKSKSGVIMNNSILQALWHLDRPTHYTHTST